MMLTSQSKLPPIFIHILPWFLFHKTSNLLGFPSKRRKKCNITFTVHVSHLPAIAEVLQPDVLQLPRLPKQLSSCDAQILWCSTCQCLETWNILGKTWNYVRLRKLPKMDEYWFDYIIDYDSIQIQSSVVYMMVIDGRMMWNNSVKKS